MSWASTLMLRMDLDTFEEEFKLGENEARALPGHCWFNGFWEIIACLIRVLHCAYSELNSLAKLNLMSTYKINILVEVVVVVGY